MSFKNPPRHRNRRRTHVRVTLRALVILEASVPVRAHTNAQAHMQSIRF